MTTTTNEFNGFPMFYDVVNPKLRAWNRLNIIFNIKEFLKNNPLSVEYASQFKKADLVELGRMAIRVKKNGYENTRREIIRGNQ